jgi:hypothetical protein
MSIFASHQTLGGPRCTNAPPPGRWSSRISPALRTSAVAVELLHSPARRTHAQERGSLPSVSPDALGYKDDVKVQGKERQGM